MRHEPRWHASLAVLAAVVLYVTLPPRLTIGPVWAAPVLVLLVLIPLSILEPRRRRETRRTRFWSILIIALVNVFNLTSVLLLIAHFFHPEKAAHSFGRRSLAHRRADLAYERFGLCAMVLGAGWRRTRCTRSRDEGDRNSQRRLPLSADGADVHE